MNVSKITSYQEFWPFYLREHSHPLNRGLHLFGTSLSVALILPVIALKPVLLPLLVILGYAFAWVGHFVIEKNRPATFQYPWWSFRSDFKMLFHFLTGSLQSELDHAGVKTTRSSP